MNVRRAEILMIEFPFHEGSGSKLRPAVVVQSDQDNARLGTTVVVMEYGEGICVEQHRHRVHSDSSLFARPT